MGFIKAASVISSKSGTSGATYVTVPNDENWTISRIELRYTASATAGARQPFVQFLDPTGTYANVEWRAGGILIANEIANLVTALSDQDPFRYLASGGSTGTQITTVFPPVTCNGGTLITFGDHITVDANDVAQISVWHDTWRYVVDSSPVAVTGAPPQVQSPFA